MTATTEFQAGGYKYINGVFQYSGGVAALPGFEIERVRFANPLPVSAGFQAIGAHLKEIGRPLQAFCACELRSPAPFDDAGFIAFNREYIKPLQEWKIAVGDDNPVARSNVCPEIDPPDQPVFYAFSYTVPSSNPGGGNFVISGSAEAKDGNGSYRERTVRYGDQSSEAMREKAQWVMNVMGHRLDALDFGWRDVANAHIYTIHDIHPFIGDELVSRGAARGGLTWHFSRPPVDTLDYEMDVRTVSSERYRD